MTIIITPWRVACGASEALLVPDVNERGVPYRRTGCIIQNKSTDGSVLTVYFATGRDSQGITLSQGECLSLESTQGVYQSGIYIIGSSANTIGVAQEELNA